MNIVNLSKYLNEITDFLTESDLQNDQNENGKVGADELKDDNTLPKEEVKNTPDGNEGQVQQGQVQQKQTPQEQTPKKVPEEAQKNTETSQGNAQQEVSAINSGLNSFNKMYNELKAALKAGGFNSISELLNYANEAGGNNTQQAAAAPAQQPQNTPAQQPQAAPAQQPQAAQ